MRAPEHQAPGTRHRNTKRVFRYALLVRRSLCAGGCAMLFAGILSVAQNALACGTCYGAVDTPMTRGLNGAIFSLLGVLIFTLSCFVYFIFSLIRRSKLAAKLLDNPAVS